MVFYPLIIQTNRKINDLLNDIRSLNAALFVGGIGEDYSMSRIIQIASQFGFAAWGHTPIMTTDVNQLKDFDIFQGFIPRMLEGINYSEGYLGFNAQGDFHNLTSASQSIFSAPELEKSLFPGYVRTARGLLLEGTRDNIELNVSFAPSINSLDKYTIEIPIIDAEDAGAHFENKEIGQKLIDQWLAARAIRNRDLGALNQLSQKHPDQDIFKDLIERIQHHTDNGGDSYSGSSQLYSDETVHSTWMGHGTKRADQPSNSLDSNQVNAFSRVDSFAPGKQPESASNSSNSVNLHSGPVGPLSDSATINSLPNARKPNARAYDSIPKLSNPTLVVEKNNSKHTIDLSRLLRSDKPIVLGRSDDSNIQLKNESLSRKHCEISIQNDIFYIKDLNSRNGTFLNEKILSAQTRYPLKTGDQIRIGGITLTFLDKDS